MAAPPAPESLPRSLKLAFGAPAFAGAAMAIPTAVLMPRFYSDVVLAPLGLIAIGIALARAFDALTDPVMGWLSDRTHSRWGRRKPYIALGAPFSALAFYALFAPPELDPSQAALWFGASFALFFLFDTMTGIPYAALGAELSPAYTERSSLFGYRSFFIASGTIFASLFPAVVSGLLGVSDERLVYRSMATLYAVLLLGLGLVLLLRVPERRDFVRRRHNPLVPGVRRALRNRPFRILLIAGAVKAVPAAIPALLMPYFVAYVLGVGEPEAFVGVFLLVYLGSGLLCVPLWMAVARRLGKLATLVIASSIGIAASLFFFLAGPGDLLFAGCIYAVTGTVSMAGTFLVPAMAADVIDYDELRTARRREAQYTAFWNLIPKFVAIPGSSIPLAILASVGYVPNAVQSDTVTFWIRFLYSIFPACFYLAALLVVSRYPISEAVHDAIRRGITAHGRGEDAPDPLTGARLPPPERAGTSEGEGWFLDHFAPRELERLLERGPGRLVLDTGLGFVAAGGVLVGAATVAVWGLTRSELPLLVILFAVVTVGLAAAAAVFHGLRLAAALRMRRQPLPAERVRAHLAELAAAAGGAGALAPPAAPARASGAES